MWVGHGSGGVGSLAWDNGRVEAVTPAPNLGQWWSTSGPQHKHTVIILAPFIGSFRLPSCFHLARQAEPTMIQRSFRIKLFKNAPWRLESSPISPWNLTHKSQMRPNYEYSSTMHGVTLVSSFWPFSKGQGSQIQLLDFIISPNQPNLSQLDDQLSKIIIVITQEVILESQIVLINSIRCIKAPNTNLSTLNLIKIPNFVSYWTIRQCNKSFATTLTQ